MWPIYKYYKYKKLGASVGRWHLPTKVVSPMASTFVPQNLSLELGRSARRGVAESEPRLTLSMGRKIIEIPWENKG